MHAPLMPRHSPSHRAGPLAACRIHGAKLIIARLDRLARNVAFVSNLMESGVDFEAVDFPQANRLTIHILAAVAEHEAKAISERTKAALAAAKRRGVKLGGYRERAKLTRAARQAGSEATARVAAKRAADLAPVIAELPLQSAFQSATCNCRVRIRSSRDTRERSNGYAECPVG
jgi:hypothetical protein